MTNPAEWIRPSAQIPITRTHSLQMEGVGALASGNGFDGAGDGRPERVAGAGCDPSEERLELSEGIFDGVEVGAVGGGGRKRSSAPAGSKACRMATPLWLPRLAMISTSPGRRVGTSIFRT